MEKYTKIKEIDYQLNKNAENTNRLKRRFFDIQREEEIYRKDIFSCTSDIEALSQVIKGDVLLKIQSNAYALLDEIKENVENAFLSEREQVEKELRALDGEKKTLIETKKELMEE